MPLFLKKQNFLRWRVPDKIANAGLDGAGPKSFSMLIVQQEIAELSVSLDDDGCTQWRAYLTSQSSAA